MLKSFIFKDFTFLSYLMLKLALTNSQVYHSIVTTMANIASQIKTAKENFDKKQLSLKSHFDIEIENLLKGAKEEVVKALKEASDAFLEIPEDNRAQVLSDSTVKALLNKFGVKIKKKPASFTVSDETLEQIKKLLSKELIGRKELIKKADVSSMTITNAMKQLVAAKVAVAESMGGRKKGWKLA